MKQIKTLTVNGQTYEIADPDAAHIDDGSVGANAWSSQRIAAEISKVDDFAAIVNATSGEVLSVTDASNRPLRGLILYGKTTQNGTPTPDAPVALETVGAGGSIGVQVCGKNLLPYPYYNSSGTGVSANFETQADGGIKCSGTPTDYVALVLYNGAMLVKNGHMTFSLQGNYKNVVHDLQLYDAEDNLVCNVTASLPVTTINIDSYPTAIRMRVVTKRAQNNVALSGVVYPQLEAGTEATEWEPYKPVQTLTAQTPKGLPGIPVDSGGNYTDENGQQWVCDEVDFARGVYVQRVTHTSLDGTEKISLTVQNDMNRFLLMDVLQGLKLTASGANLFMLCNSYKVLTDPVGNNYVNNAMCGYKGAEHIYIRDDSYGSADEYKAFLANKYSSGNPVSIIYALETPIETPLSAKELTQYAALHTNFPNTTVYSDSNAGIGLAYVADTKTYIDNKFNELAAAIVANT